MKVAIATEGNVVSSHFARCQSFIVLNIEDGKLVNETVIQNPGHRIDFLPRFLKEENINCVVAGGMGIRARELCENFAIKTILRVSGNTSNVITDLVRGTLEEGERLGRPGSGKDDYCAF